MPALPSNYQRREPEKTLQYQVVSGHLNTFLARADADDKPVPGFIRKEFEDYLECGILAHGFARVFCEACRHSSLVPFSCKGRGFCSSCMARRGSETAAHLVDCVVPDVPTRQWVLSVPPPLRFLLAYEAEACSAVLDIFITAVFQWLRRQAKIELDLKRTALAHPGAITFIQRFGSALNINVHFHTLVTAGVFVKNAAGDAEFHALRGPSESAVHEISLRIATRIQRWFEKRYGDFSDGDFHDPFLASCYRAAIRRGPTTSEASSGLNLHVSAQIHANDRAGRERLLRYMGRPPLSEDRLKSRPDGGLMLRLKRPWSDGTTHVVLTPLDFLERLSALVPPPRAHQIRYHGVFAPNAKLRKEVVPKSREESSETACCGTGASPHRLTWAKLMARIFSIDVLSCPRCASRLRIISFITEEKPIHDILKALGMPTAPPPRAPSYFAMQECFDFAS